MKLKIISLSEDEITAWEVAFRKAFKQYRNRAQAERIAWAAIGRPLPKQEKRKKAA